MSTFLLLCLAAAAIYTSTLLYFVGLPLALIMADIRCGIGLCNVTTFISVKSYMHLSPRSYIDGGSWGSLLKVLSSTSQTFSMGLMSRHCGGDPCVKMMSHVPWSNLSQFEQNESWHCHPRNMPVPSGGKKLNYIDGKKPGPSVYSGSEYASGNIIR